MSAAMFRPGGRPMQQRGSVLLAALMVLLMAAIITGALLRGSMTSVQAIGNMQWRAEAISAANEAIDRVLSSADFATKTDVVTGQVNSPPFLQVDINGDGVNDIEVKFPDVTMDGSTRAGPRCLSTEPMLSKELDPDIPADVSCFNGASSGNQGLGFGKSGGAATALLSSPSLCSKTAWSIRMRATDAVTNTAVDVVQGVGVRVATDVASNYCK